MPIVLNCACGKTLRVADEHAGKRVKCPGCGAARTVEAPAAPPDDFDDFEVVEDEPTTTPPAAKAPAKAVAVEAVAEPASVKAKEAPPEPANPFANLGKKKKKKKKKKATAEGDDDSVEKALEAQARMVRIARGGAYVALGVVILAGFGYICLTHWQNVRDAIWWIQIAVYALPIIGLAALGKGVIGLAFGQFLGDDD